MPQVCYKASLLLIGIFLLVNPARLSAADTPENPVELTLREIHTKASTGLPYYQAYMGIIYRTGYKNVVISFEKSLYWSKLSADQSHPLGLANLGALRLSEIEWLKSKEEMHAKREEAISLYQDAYFNGLSRLARYGDPLAADLLADYYLLSTPPSPHLQEQYLKQAIESGYARSLAALGFFQITGFGGITKDTEEGVYHLEKAAAQFLPEGLMNLATAYLKGDGVPQSKEKAILLYKEAARRGHLKAKRALQKVKNYEVKPKSPIASTPKVPLPSRKQWSPSPKTPKKLPAATKRPSVTEAPPTTPAQWLLRAKQGEPGAQRHVGLMYWVGKGVEKDLDQAMYWLNLSARQGDALAKKRIQLLEKLYGMKPGG